MWATKILLQRQTYRLERVIASYMRKEKPNLNYKQKTLVSILVLAMMAFSVAATIAPAFALVDNNTLKLAGSSTVYPISVLASQTFPTYWNNLVDANPAWSASRQTAPMVIAGLGSGTAFSGILPTSGTATSDIGQMSRPPTLAEWNQANAANAQIWALGVDSIAIVYREDMASWAPTQLTQVQAAKLFESTDLDGNTPVYTTWGQFLNDYYGVGNVPAAAQAHMNDPINRAVRSATSGTADCWNNFFGNKFGSPATNLRTSGGEVIGWQYMATHIPCQTNQDVYNRLQDTPSCIGFISLGYLDRLGHMTGVSIWNSAANPADYYAPSRQTVIAGTYTAMRYLWDVTASTIPTTGADLEKGVFIAYQKLENPDFVEQNDYIALSRADMAGGQVVDSNLAPYVPKPGQTQTVPDMKVDSSDFFYFVDAYVKYYSIHTYNPYADFDANGIVDSSDFFGFVNSYVEYYTAYNPEA